MAAAVQSGPPPGLGLSAHSSPAMSAMVSRPMPLPLPPPLMHHHPPSNVDSSANGPPNPEVLLALLSRNKNLEGKKKLFTLFCVCKKKKISKENCVERFTNLNGFMAPPKRWEKNISRRTEIFFIIIIRGTCRGCYVRDIKSIFLTFGE